MEGKLSRSSSLVKVVDRKGLALTDANVNSRVASSTTLTSHSVVIIRSTLCKFELKMDFSSAAPLLSIAHFNVPYSVKD